MHSAQCVPAYAGLRTILVPTSQQVSSGLESLIQSANFADMKITGDRERAVVVSGANGEVVETQVTGCFLVRVTFDVGVSYVWCEPGTTRLILPRAATGIAVEAAADAAVWSEQLQALEKSK